MDDDRDWAVGTRIAELADDGSILCVSDNGTRRRVQVAGTVEMQRRIQQLEACLAWTVRNMGRIEDAAFYAGTYKQMILDSVEYIRAHNQAVLDAEIDLWESEREKEDQEHVEYDAPGSGTSAPAGE